MAVFEEKEIELSKINGGNRYLDGEVLVAETINSVVEASAYAQSVSNDAKSKADEALKKANDAISESSLTFRRLAQVQDNVYYYKWYNLIVTKSKNTRSFRVFGTISLQKQNTFDDYWTIIEANYLKNLIGATSFSNCYGSWFPAEKSSLDLLGYAPVVSVGIDGSTTLARVYTESGEIGGWPVRAIYDSIPSHMVYIDFVGNYS